MPTDRALLRRAEDHLRRADAVLAPVIDRVGACRMPSAKLPAFAKLVQVIVYQQLAGKAAATIHGRVLSALGRRHPRPADVLGASDEALRAAGLSRQKLSYLRDLATRASDGLPLGRLGRMSDEDVRTALTSVKGIGRWTAEMFLMFHLGRLDVLPVDDYGIRKAMQRFYRLRALPKPARMERIAEPWRPYRTIACWYLWRGIDGEGKA
jgi:DNA-3-methyladenine glycosylase II